MTTITQRNVDRLQHVAVSRLTVFVGGRVHALLYPVQKALVDAVRAAGDTDGAADSSTLAMALNQFDGNWRRFVSEYMTVLQNARKAAGDIAWMPWRLRHNRCFPVAVEQVQEAVTPTASDYARLVEMWARRRSYALQVAQERIYSDGLTLSQRIWRLQNGGMTQIRTTIAAGMAERTNAWALAEQLERQLNADQQWPKWSEQRLREMDPTSRAQSRDGLWRNAAEQRAAMPMDGLSAPAGISYNALRLARNEIQAANHAVTSEIARNFPGIVGRKVVLSPAHPQVDVCDELAAGGPYDKSANFLPAHPQCMCRWEEVLMPVQDFARQVRGWVAGDNNFLDDYSTWLGTRSFFPVPDQLGLTGALEMLNAMETWLSGDTDAMATVIQL